MSNANIFSLLLLMPLLGFESCVPNVKDIQYSPSRVMMLHEGSLTIYFSLYPSKSVMKPKEELYYYWFQSNGIHKTQGNYSGRLLDGLYSVYDLEGNLIEKGMFEKGLKQGPWVNWNTNGSRHFVYTFKDGLKQGKYYAYDTAGILKKEYRFRRNRLHGKITDYDSILKQQMQLDTNKKKRIEKKNSK